MSGAKLVSTPFGGSEESPYESIMKEVGVEDEWCAEAYLGTDYSDITEDMLKKSTQKYLAFRFLNNSLNFEKSISIKRKIVDPKLETVDTLFDVKNGIPSDKVEVVEHPASEYFIRYLRPSQTYQGSIAGYVDRRTVDDKHIFGEDTLYVSTDGQGSHTYSYVSSFEFILNSNVAVLIPKKDMNINEKLYYSLCITINRFKYSYGRKPKGNRLKTLLIPNIPPAFVYKTIFENILEDWREIFK